MRFPIFLCCVWLVQAGATIQHPLRTTSSSDLLSLTAVVSSSQDPRARIECWQFLTPVHVHPTIGKSLPLADLSNVTYVVLPPSSSEGLHNPPSPMLFVLVSGMAHVTLPEGDDELWIKNWENQVIVAADVVGIGHNTIYPLQKETIALQLPFRDGQVPEHRVAKQGACTSSFD